jgi:hypothetical protein
MTKKRKTPRQLSVSIYLGDQETRPVRAAKLDEIAAQFGVSRSVMFQKIADGELIVVKPEDKQ